MATLQDWRGVKVGAQRAVSFKVVHELRAKIVVCELDIWIFQKVKNVVQYCREHQSPRYFLF